MAELEKIVVVTKRTALADLILRLNTRDQARFYLEQNGVAFAEYEAADRAYQAALGTVRAALPRTIAAQFLDRDLLPTVTFGPHDLVITLGPDGLVVNTAKYLTTQPILALNPDPARVDGVLLPFRADEVRAVLARVLRGPLRIQAIAMAQATLNDGQTLYAVNDLFIGHRSHGSARYLLEVGGQAEHQSSSGIIVSTGAGCTGWLRSITWGAWQVAHYFAPGASAPPTPADLALGWDSPELWYTVREPFVSRTSAASLVFGRLARGESLRIVSELPEAGVIFSDGVEADSLAFSAGAIARVGLADRVARLIGRGTLGG